MQNRRKLIIASGVLVTCLLVASVVFTLYAWSLREVEISHWSLQGEWIVFFCAPVGDGAESSLYIVRPDGSELTRLTTGRQSVDSPSWSPDGKEIVFESPRGKLAKLKRRAKELTPLSITGQPYTSEEYPVFSPDGQWIAFIARSWSGKPAALYRVSADGSAIEHVISDVQKAPISWSPDGEWIFYNVPSWNVRRIRADGSEVRDLPIGWEVHHPAWSLDGEWIAFNDSDGLSVARNDGSELTRLIDLRGGTFSPAWSPDGQWIVFSSYGQSIAQLFKIRADGSDLQQITDQDCPAQSPDWIKMPEDE